MKNRLIEFLEKNLELDCEIDFNKLVEKPKISNQGDFSLPCFILAKSFGKNPAMVSSQIKEDLSSKLPDFICEIKSIGPFLNFYLNSQIESKEVLESVFNEDYKNLDIGKNKNILIEYPSPNSNKALHIGHSRNMLLGIFLTNVLRRLNFNPIHCNINNDRGIAICKTMLSYKLFGENSTPSSMNLKSDEFVSHFYVLFGIKNKENPQLELDKKAQEMLVLWENGDVETRELWKKLMDYVFEGYLKTYENYKMPEFDKQYFESQIFGNGKEIVLNALKNNVAGFKKEEDGAIYFDFENEQYGKKYLLRGDGTTMYMTQDLYLASLKKKDFKDFERSIFLVGHEQKYHFEVLFQLLEKLGISTKNENYHFAYGMIYDKDGKPFSSRNGTTISADEILEEVIEKSKNNLLSRENSKNLSELEINKRASVIGFAAFSFSVLKVNPLDDMKFDIEKSISFEGETSSYIQYTYSRIKSILRKSDFEDLEKLKNLEINYSSFLEIEMNLIKVLKEYNEVLVEAGNKYKLSLIPNFLIKLSQSYNDFYQNCHILNEENKELKDARLKLSLAVSNILKDGLSLLNIEVLEEM